MPFGGGMDEGSTWLAGLGFRMILMPSQTSLHLESLQFVCHRALGDTSRDNDVAQTQPIRVNLLNACTASATRSATLCPLFDVAGPCVGKGLVGS
ncbi:unnamed protein product [Protopolystoma xenopodis]|uniref:Uncharacterized protein n=1 Tax=Protopolystoma xenopodis TaxID=117903 RepID=A0A448W9T6_9PLAT|nr:unnamed protein product [Protopolystoma xenopodis]